MPTSEFHTFPFHTFPKENILGTGGMNEIFMSTPTLSHVPGTYGNGWEPVGTGELSDKPKAGLFFHWLDAGVPEEQGHLLTLGADGFGTVQMYEWFFGEPSRVQSVTPDYLRACVFYTSAAAMNAAYQLWEVNHD